MSDRARQAVEQWRKERPDLDPFPMQVVGQLGEAALIIARDHLNPFFARYGLHPGEFDVLATLRRSGEPYALTPTALYEAAMISSGGMTNRIDRLERAEFIERKRHPTDRRGTLVALTAKGITLIDELMALHIENERKVLSGLTEAEQSQLDKLLGKLIGNLEVES
ncbi:DNA-binding MarR family transcriptional regulator [Pseudomonas duriflava]|uniref:DNA-binding MarR family transcriptional regulator n=1 Tax=Pseudomonas duriflava TaxID=459528 RepID=A0A562Q7G2_9PSED|nr:MarR family transcriptional regulator [Pseudomonas duriflava]TWI52702.1 DNA-binding MarR family transcriptional regulator [Pseudomonas duriflava]